MHMLLGVACDLIPLAVLKLPSTNFNGKNTLRVACDLIPLAVLKHLATGAVGFHAESRM